MDLDDARVGNQSDAKVSAKGSQQRRGAVGIRLQRIGDQIRLSLIGMAAELGAPIEIQLPDHLQRHQIALQYADLGIEIALVVIIDHRPRIFEGDEIGSALLAIRTCWTEYVLLFCR